MENNLEKFPPAPNVVVENSGSIGLMAPINAQDSWKTRTSEIVMLLLPLIRFPEINGPNDDLIMIYILFLYNNHLYLAVYLYE
jgi:hypothetical protein